MLALLRRRLPLAALLFVPSLAAQMSGARGHVAAGVQGVGGPDPSTIERYIEITGRAELRRAPTRIRIVLAVTTEAKEVADCERTHAAQKQALGQALAGLGIGADAIHFDFISMLPVYRWIVEEENGRRIAHERGAGYREQTNAHIEVGSEARAQEAIRAAFDVGIADVLAVDYWAEGLDEARREAGAAALQEAKRKADLLLGAAFAKRPDPINIHESTQIVLPQDLYASFETSYGQEFRTTFWDRDIPSISAFRPKNTYYQGRPADVDVGAGGLPMRPEIAIVATVKLYFEAPGRPAVPPR